MFTRILTSLVISFFLSLCSISASACENYPLSDEQRAYLEELSLPMEIPKGAFAKYVPNRSHERPPTDSKPECWLNQDFNNDGIDDFAGLFQHTGEEIRSSGWSLDLVILYSDEGQLRHIVFPYAGQVTTEGDELRQHLGVQSAGRVELEPGSVTLELPGILSYRDGQPAVVYFWQGKRFVQRVFFTDI